MKATVRDSLNADYMPVIGTVVTILDKEDDGFWIKYSKTGVNEHKCSSPMGLEYCKKNDVKLHNECVCWILKDNLII